MKKTIWLVILACVCSAQASPDIFPIESLKLSFDSNYPLYLSDHSKFSFDEIDLALDRAYARKQPVLFLVHGRGNEPKKSLDKGTFVEGGAVRKLEAHFKLTVIMFNWESRAFLYDRSVPLSKMKASSDSLARVLEKMKIYFSIRPNLSRPTLLAHSMGSIVLENYSKSYGWIPDLQKNLFANVILTSPDADNSNHWEWIDEIGKKENVFVTINQKDDILEKSTDSRTDGAFALGLVPEAPYSTRAKYLDASGIIGGVHEIFNKEKMKFQVNLCEILTRLLYGKNPELSSKNTIPTEIRNYMKIKNKTSETDACFTL